MSDRQNWFRFVAFTFVFAFVTLALGLRVDAQGSLVAPAEATLRNAAEEKAQKDFLDELLPYSTKAFAIDTSANIISAGTYPFTTQTSVALEDMSSGTTQLLGASQDDTASALTNIGFDVWVDGVRYTQFSVNPNGLMKFGSPVVNNGANGRTNNFATANDLPKIAPYWDDLCLAANGQVHYKVVGTPGSRKLVVEWQNTVTFGTSCTTGLAIGTFQVWISETTGIVQFVYGAIGANAVTQGGYSIGIGSSATSFASVTSATDTVSYVASDNAQIGAIAAGKSYLFTPNIPTQPTNFVTSMITKISLQIGWNDNASNEVGYAIYRSTDGTNFSFLTQTAADAVSFNDTNLLPGTTYFYRVFAVTEGGVSAVLTGSETTDPAGNVSCTGAGGNWNSPGTWAGGVVPTAGDNVTIVTGCTVTIDVTTAAALSLAVQSGGTLQFIDTPASTLTVTMSVVVAAGGTIQSAATGTTITHLLSIGGDLANNGTVDLSTNGDTAGAELRFVGATNNTYAGSGTNDLRLLTVNKGSGNITTTSPTLDINVSNMSVRGLSTGGVGFLNTTLFNGIVKFSGTNTFGNAVFQTAAYTIPATGGFWMNNPNFTVTGQNGSPTNTGLLRVSDGTFNVGIASGNSMGGGAGGQFVIDGGTLNFAGRLQTTSAVSYSQSGGTVNVCTVGNTATTACFGLTSATNVFNLTGGTIVLVLPNTNAAPLDWSVSTTAVFTANPAGTTLQVGGGATPPASTFRVLGNTPNISISTGQTMAVGSGAAGGAIFFRGSSVVNNGAIVVQGTGASSRFDWAANGPMTYGGTGTFGTAATSFVGVGMSANGGNTTINAPIFINRINVFAGGFINSNQVTLGNGGTSSTVVQIGNSTTPTNSGTFDVSPTYNTGSGGHIVLHLRTTTLNRMTGFEINPTRSLATWTVDDNAVGGTLTIAGGNLAVAGAMTLTNGVVVTGANTITHNGAATRTAGYINGNLNRTYAAPGAYTYHVGQNAYSPVAANVTAGTGDLAVQAIATAQPNVPTPSKALSRYWKLAGTGVTSDLTFSYLDADIPVTATESNFVIMKYDGTFTQPGGTVDTGANTASITGVTSFSDWTLAEPGALVAPGVLALSSATYSANENSGNLVVTVNRTGGTDGAVTVDYALAGGTATGGASCSAGVDYVNTGGTVSFANGEPSKTFNVAFCPDTDVEPDETFDVTLSNPTGGATLGMPTVATATILNDDVAGGPITVTASAGTPSGSYATLTAAIAAVNDGTHQGDIVVSVNQSVVEPGTVVINGSGAGAALYTSLLIRPTADGLTVTGASVQGRGLIELNGADNVTIDGDNPNTGGTNRNLTIQNTAANTVTFTSVIRIALAATIVTSADNNTFKNLNISGSATGRNIGTANTTTGTENNSFAIFSGPGASTVSATTPPAAVTSVTTGAPAGSTASNLIVSNNSVTTAARGISINGAAATVYPGLQVAGNTVGNPTAGNADQVYTIGITAQGSANGVVSGNTVWVEGFAPTAVQGINVSTNSTVGTFTVELNKVNRARNNNITTFGAYGINLGGSTNHVVRNNFVSGVINDQTAGTGAFSTTFGAFGIRILGTGHSVYHNSVHLYGALPGTVSTNLTAALAIVGTAQTGVNVRNNLFSNQISGGNPAGTSVRHAVVFLPSGGTAAMNLTWNNNGYFEGIDPKSRLAQVGATAGTGEFLAANFDPTATTPATNFRAYTSTLSAAGTNDNASFAVSGAPPVTSDVDLHIPVGTPTRLESGGAAVGVTVDIDAETRNATTPDIGADEFAGNPAPPNDIAAASFVNPVPGSNVPTGSVFTPQARFLNNGTAPQTNVTVRFRIVNSSMVEVYNQTAVIPSIAPLQNLAVSFPATSIGTAGAYTMFATAELVGDTNTANDTINAGFNVVDPIGGTISVGTGQTYTSLTNAGGLFQALNNAGISSNVTVNITSDLTGETGAVALNQLAEAGSGGYTVTIKPSGAARVISGSSAANSGLIILHGADRIIFDGSTSGGTDRSLTITNNQATGGIVIWMRSPNASNGATNNTVKNCILNGAPGPNSTTVAGVLTGSSVTLGGDAEAPNSNNTIQNNWIYRVQNAMYLRGGLIAANFDQNWNVSGNELGSAVVADKNIFRGMLIGNSANFTITGNTVHGIQSTTTTTAAMSGIQLGLLLSNGTVTNNQVFDIKNVSASGTGAHGISIIATSTASNVTIANNFVSDIAANGSATVASNGHGIAFLSLAPGGSGYNVYFNSVNLNTNQATAQTSAAMFITSTFNVAGAINARNNIFSNSETTGTRYGVYSLAPASVFAAIDYNDYFAQNVGFIGGSARPTLADWQTGTGQDANSKSVDPLFVSPTNLHLQAGSTLINMGVAGTGITTDIDGQARDGMPDIGADEIVAVANPGTLQFSSPTYSIGEDGGLATVTITRTGGSAGMVGVDFATSNGTATGGGCGGPGVDYSTTSGTRTWADGDVTPKTFTVPICDDAVDETDETFNLTLSNPSGGAVLGTPSTAVHTIVDNDGPVGTLSINDVRAFEGNSGAMNLVFTVSYSGPTVPVSVQYATANGTATAGVDYLAASGTVSFNTAAAPEGIPAPQTATITVVVNGDVAKEANETFFVNLSSPSGASITDGQGVGIIIDDDRAYVADFDLDRVSDFSVFRPSQGRWYALQSASAVPKIVDFGETGDTAVPGDYDGDGITDIAVWRPNGYWYRLLSSNGSTLITIWGVSGDKPVQGDYDGDGKTDLAVYRPSTGTWWILRSSNGASTTVPFGLVADRPVQGDYDGDAKTDVAVYRDGTWYILRSSDGAVQVGAFGLASDRPVSGDFDGDGKYDLAIYRGGVWWILRSLTGAAVAVPWGAGLDIPVPADYDGDGTSDLAVFRPSTGDWYVIRSSNSTSFGIHWGVNGDVPIPAAYIPQ